MRRVLGFLFLMMTCVAPLARAEPVFIVGFLEDFRMGRQTDWARLAVGPHRFDLPVPQGTFGSDAWLKASLWRDFLMAARRQNRPLGIWVDWPASAPAPASLDPKNPQSLRVTPLEIAVMTRVARGDIQDVGQGRFIFTVSQTPLDERFCDTGQALLPSGWTRLADMKAAALAGAAQDIVHYQNKTPQGRPDCVHAIMGDAALRAP